VVDPLSAAPRPSKGELVARQLRTAIQLGHYLPGQRFPAERELSAQLGVSRSVLREASRVLEAEGLIEVRHGRNGGLVVSVPTSAPSEVRRLLKEQRTHVEAVFDYRIAVETAAARLAATRRTAADLRALHTSLTQMDAIIALREAGPEVTQSWKAADNRFHGQIAHAARNPLLEEAVIRGHAEMHHPIAAVFDRLELDMHEPHVEIVAAIEAKDADRAERLMRDHIEHSREITRRYMRAR
jgi:DNA-binding FadR family transcriptional regulator